MGTDQGIEEARALHAVAFDSLTNYRQVWNRAEAASYTEGLGRLVIITEVMVAAAARKCIKLGRRTTLAWDMNQLNVANFNRQPAQHHIVGLLGGLAFDDVYVFNPQQSSQWDGLRHFSAPFSDQKDSRLYYGGVSAKEITDRSSDRIGMQHWAQEGICGRGVLLDYASYAKRHGIDYSCFSDHSISLETLLDVAKEQNNLGFLRGDILLIRIGLVHEWEKEMGTTERMAYATTKSPQHAGVEGTMEMLRWIWDTGFAAVGGDSLSFEKYPPEKEYRRGGTSQPVPGLFMHEVLLAGWGMPIGELFDLEKLSKICEEEGRWDFFLSSAPLNMPGGVSSPPNCIAFF
jgi:kynurenine formamidase